MFGLVPYRRNNIESVFDDLLGDSFLPAFYKGEQMKIDIKENEKEFVVEADLPGVKKEDVNIELKNDRLTIAVEKNEQVNEEKENYIRRERRYGSISRSFAVANIDEEAVKAKFENGVLTINLPKRDTPIPKKSKIEIE